MNSSQDRALLRRVARHTGIMGVGKIAGGALHLASLAVAARILGPVEFGALMLVRSYAQTAGGLAKFQSWQAVIRFGTRLVETQDRRGLRSLLRVTLGLDLLTGIGALLIAAALIPILGSSFALSDDRIVFALAYCLAIPGMTSTTPTGVVRLFDRFDLLAWQSLVTPAVRLSGLIIAWLIDAPLWGFGVAWLVSDLIGDGFLWWAAARELRRQAYLGPSERKTDTIAETRAQHPGLLRFILSTNISGSLDTLFGPVAALLIGARLGAAEAGLFRMALAVLDAVGKPAELAMRSFYPEITRLKERGQLTNFRAIVRRATLIAAGAGGVVSAVMALLSPWLIVGMMGAEYRDAVPLLQIAGLSILTTMVVFPLEAALLATGRAGSVLICRAIATGVGFAAMLFLLDQFRINGAAIALIVASALTAALMAFAIRRSPS